MNSINRPELVKQHNTDVLRRALFRARQATRQQLSALTDISTVTLGPLLRELEEAGEVYQAETEQSAGGRPAHVYCYNAGSQNGLLLYVQPKAQVPMLHIRYINRYGEPVEESARPAPCLDDAGTARFLRELLERNRPVGAVGLGLPGVGYHDYLYDHGESHFFSLPALEQLEAETGIPILMENDINLAVLGYAGSHELPREETAVYLYLMKGCHGGSGIYLNGRLHHGLGRFAGELPAGVFGVEWSKAETEQPETVCANLLKVVLPCLSLLSPHRIIVASDYIREAHLQCVRAQILTSLGIHQCPALLLAEDFSRDYAEGVRRMVLQKITVFEEEVS